MWVSPKPSPFTTSPCWVRFRSISRKLRSKVVLFLVWELIHWKRSQTTILQRYGRYPLQSDAVMDENPAIHSSHPSLKFNGGQRTPNLTFQRQTIWLESQVEQLNAFCALSDLIKSNTRLERRILVEISLNRWLSSYSSNRQPEDVFTPLSANSMMRTINSTLWEVRLTLKWWKWVIWSGFVSSHRTREKLEFKNPTCASRFEKSSIETRRKS